jgi:hypothetical protein
MNLLMVSPMCAASAAHASAIAFPCMCVWAYLDAITNAYICLDIATAWYLSAGAGRAPSRVPRVLLVTRRAYLGDQQEPDIDQYLPKVSGVWVDTKCLYTLSFVAWPLQPEAWSTGIV